MKWPTPVSLVLALGLSGGSVHAQEFEFPASAEPVSAQALQHVLAEHVFILRVVSGDVRYEFKGDYFYVDVPSTGGRAHGKWRTEDGRLCIEFMTGRATSGCAEVRARGTELWLKRITDGEVGKLTLRP